MAGSLSGGWARVVLTATFMLAACGVVQAAGEWEWTQGEGWVQGAGVSRPTAKEQLAYAYELEQKGEFMDAARQYFLLVQNFPETTEAGVGLQRLAKCLFEMENYYTSFKAVEQVVKTYPNTGRIADLIEIELRIAKKMLMSHASASVFESDASSRETNTRRALEIVDAVIEHDPYGPIAPEALLVKGEAHLYINELTDARAAFDRILDEFSKSDFVERARLGVLRCDSLLGQARPQEVFDQVQVVRDMEVERRQEGDETAERDEFDDVEESISQLAEVEAGKMMEQAEQYRRMGTHNAVKSAEFLYKEVVRRYPATPQAEEAQGKLGGITIPREQSRAARVVRNININPFTWNRDPEPPWIVPQLSPEDTVMIDSGIGPIAGVPETDFPAGDGVGIRPAASGVPSAAGFSPIDSGPPANVSGGYSPMPSGEARYSGIDDAPFASGYGAPALPVDLAPASPPPASPNPLPSISESDLIGGEYGLASGGAPAVAPYAAPSTSYTPYAPQAAPAFPAEDSSMNLGRIPDAALSDLVSPMRRLDESGAAYQAETYQGAYQAAPPLPDVPYYQTDPSFSQAPAYPSGQAPAPYADVAPAQSGGWMLGDDFR